MPGAEEHFVAVDKAIICRGLSRGYGSAPVLREVDMTVPWGALVAITGPSGSGKSTLLRILGGLDGEFSGSVICNGREICGAAVGALDAYRRDEVGFVFQELNLIDHLCALDNVALALVLKGVNEEEARREARKALGEVGLEDKAAHLPSALSGGERQRVAIARALAKRPAIILADEPTGSLDARTAAEIANLLMRLAHRGCAVVVVTHDRPLFEPLATQVITLDGKGTLSEAFSEGVPSVSCSSPRPPRASSELPPRPRRGLWADMRAMVPVAASHGRACFKRCAAAAAVCAVGVLGLGLMVALLVGMQTYSNVLQCRLLNSVPLTITPQLLAPSSEEDGAMAPSSEAEGDEPVAYGAASLLSDGTLERFQEARMAPGRAEALGVLERVLREECAAGELPGVQSIQPMYPYTNDVAVLKGDRWELLDPASLLPLAEGVAGEAAGQELDLAGAALGQDAFFKPLVSGKPEDLERAYGLVAGRYPESPTEIVLVARSDGTVSDALLVAAGLLAMPSLDEPATVTPEASELAPMLSAESEQVFSVSIEELFGLRLRLLEGCDEWVNEGGSWVQALPGTALFDEAVEQGISLSVVGLCVPRYPVDEKSEMSYFGYRPDLLDEVAAHVEASAAVGAQRAGELDVAGSTGGASAGSAFSHRLADLAEDYGLSAGKVGFLRALTDGEAALLARVAGTTAEAVEQGRWRPSSQQVASWRSLDDATFAGRVRAMLAAGSGSSAALDLYGPEDMEQLHVFVRTLDDWSAVSAVVGEFNDTRAQMGLALVEVVPSPDIDLMRQTLLVMDIILLALGALSFLVVFATTTSTMATFAVERRGEVGCLRSMGASRGQVMALFLIEAVVMGLAAWGVGSLGIVGCATLISDAVAEAIGWAGLITYTLPCAFAVLVITGLVSAVASVVPARRAAGADPLDVLCP